MTDRLTFTALLVLLGAAMLVTASNGHAPGRSTRHDRVEATPPPGSSARSAPVHRDPIGDLLRQYRIDDEPFSGRIIIATVPDPIESHVGYQFDRVVEAIRLAMSQAGYEPDRFYLPWGEGLVDEEPSAGVSNWGHRGTDAPGAWPPVPAAFNLALTDHGEAHRHRAHAHQVKPGAMLFRSPKRPSHEDVLILLVGETPTFGIHPRALEAALEWTRHETEVSMLGPYYSGSAPSLANALRTWREKAGRGRRLRVTTGSATADRVEEEIRAVGAEFVRTIDRDSSVRRAAERQLKELGFSFAPTEIALLHEAGTAYGAGPGDTSEGWVRLPYPIHVAHLRDAYQSEGVLPLPGRTSLNQDEVSSLRLSLGPLGAPADVPGASFPSIAANTAELMLAHTLDALARENIRAVGILGTDTLDKIFLAQLIRRRLGGVQVFTFDSDVLYTHPAFASELTGMWIFSSYPGSAATQVRGNGTRIEFASSEAQGVYNAVLAILPRANWLQKDPDRDHSVVHWSVVGRDRLWQIARLPEWPRPSASDLVQPVSCSPAPCSAPANGPVAKGPSERSANLPFALIVALLDTLALLLSAAYWLPRCFGPLAVPRPTLLWLFNHHNFRPRRLTPTDQALATAVALILWCVLTHFHRFVDAGHGNAASASIALGACIYAFVAWLALTGTLLALLMPKEVPWLALPLSIAMACGLFAWWSPLSWETVERSTDLRSRVSPLVPVGLLAAGAVLMLLAHAKRRYVLRGFERLGCFAEDAPALRHCIDLIGDALRISVSGRGAPHPSPVEQRSSGGQSGVVHGSRRERRQRPSASLVLGIAMVVVTVGTSLAARHSPSIEGRIFDLVTGVSFLLLFGMVLHATLQFVTVWYRLRRFLRWMGWGPLVGAFDRLPKELGAAFSFTIAPPSCGIGALRYSADHVTALMNQASNPPLSPLGATPLLARGERELWRRAVEVYERELNRAAPVLWRVADYQACFQVLLTRQVGLLFAALRRQWAAETPRMPDADTEAPRGRADLLGASRATIRTDADLQVRLAEETVALHVARFAGYVFVHLKNLAGAATVGMVLLVLAVASYPFQPATLLMRWAVGGLVVVTGLILSVLVQVERDGVLSRIGNRRPDQVDFDRTFLSQIGVYVLLPLATLLVSQFPSLNGLISGIFRIVPQ